MKALDKEQLSFKELFEKTDGMVANLNKVLKDMKKRGWVSFEPEMFWQDNTSDLITLEEPFYEVSSKVYDPSAAFHATVDEKEAEVERKGRSFEQENAAAMQATNCAACGQALGVERRFMTRGQVFHLRCVRCDVCGARFDAVAGAAHDLRSASGALCCSTKCIGKADQQHAAGHQR